MVLVSSKLVNVHLKESSLLKLYQLLEQDLEVQTYLRMANVMAVDRLKYNDHGPVHSRIVVGGALEVFNLLSSRVTPSLIKNDVGDLEDSKIVVLCSAYLHDVGNSVHRKMHNLHSYVISEPILNKLLPEIYPDERHMLEIKQEILHCLFSSNDNIQCLSMEAGVVKIADGLDMAEGRARIPYKTGKVDIHSLSALAIRKLEVVKGETRPVRIFVDMDNPAGVFQIEWVLERKIKTSGLEDFIEVVALQNGTELKTFKY